MTNEEAEDVLLGYDISDKSRLVFQAIAAILVALKRDVIYEVAVERGHGTGSYTFYFYLR